MHASDQLWAYNLNDWQNTSMQVKCICDIYVQELLPTELTCTCHNLGNHFFDKLLHRFCLLCRISFQ